MRDACRLHAHAGDTPHHKVTLSCVQYQIDAFEDKRAEDGMKISNKGLTTTKTGEHVVHALLGPMPGGGMGLGGAWG